MRPYALALLCVVAALGSATAESPQWPPHPWAAGPLESAPLPPGARSGPPPGWTAPVPEAAVLQDLDEEQFITHWVYTYNVMDGGVDVDLIGESSFQGLCSTDPISSAPDAPSTGPNYSGGPTMYTGCWAAWNEEECTYFATNSSMYFYTWIRVPTTQQVRAILGAADYFKLWINHTLVMSRTSGGPATYLLDQYQQTATLNQGWNLILFKHSFPQLGPEDDPNPDNIYKYFSLRFTTPGGVPVHPIAGFDPMCSYSERDGQYTRVIVPSIAHLPGSGGSQWRTDTLLVNGTHMTWNYELNYFREGNASGTPNAVARLDIPPYGTVSFADALRHSGLFGVSSDQKGYFDVRRQLYHYLKSAGWLQDKVYNQAPAGSFGMQIPVQYVWDGISYSAVFYGLRNGAYRTNLGMVPWDNAGATARVRVTLFGPDLAAPVSREFGPFEGMWQRNDIFDALGVGGLNTARTALYLQILENPNGTYWYPYVAVNDNGTSDPIFFTKGSLGSFPPELEN
jgi:hypothetical protein